MKKALKTKRQITHYSIIMAYGTYEGGCYGGSCYVNSCKTNPC